MTPGFLVGTGLKENIEGEFPFRTAAKGNGKTIQS
jgi:hypothetical protein